MPTTVADIIPRVKLKANSHIPCHAPAIRLPCHVAKKLDCVFPIWITQCDHVWVRHTMPGLCHALTTLLCDFSRPCHGTCELTSAISQRPVGNLPSFSFFWPPCGISWLAVRVFPATWGFSRMTRYCWRMAGAQHGMCELEWHSRNGAWQGQSTACVN
jgi:hypothetical protein